MEQTRPGKSHEQLFCSWSGGKDSALALYRAQRSVSPVRALLTMALKGGARTRSHGLSRQVVEAQANSLGIPLRVVETEWNRYEENFTSALYDLASEGFNVGVFGDIDIVSHREWVERVSSTVGVRSLEPLWQENRWNLLSEFLDLGFRALIVAVDSNILPRRFLGQELTLSFASDIAEYGVDIAGENGEYHTVVFDGPLFAEPLALESGKQLKRAGYWFQDLRLECDNSASHGLSGSDFTPYSSSH